MDTIANRPPTTFWVVAGLLLVWELIGCAVYISEMTRDVSALPLDQQRLYDDTPIWAAASFAIAVWSGLAAAIAMLIRRRLAVPLFILSLVAIVVNDIYWFGFTDVVAIMGSEAFFMPLIVLMVGIFAVWYSRTARTRGWLR